MPAGRHDQRAMRGNPAFPPRYRGLVKLGGTQIEVLMIEGNGLLQG